MKLLSSSLVIGAAAAAVAAQAQQPLQQVLQDAQRPLKESKDFVKGKLPDSLKAIKDQIHHLGDDVKAAWEEIAAMYPEDMGRQTFGHPPKKHTRKPDSEWDHIIHGADVQSVWVENKNGEKEREIDGKLEDFSLRVKKVDPSALGIDPGVKQYSGYLDDNENDKHLFYCKYTAHRCQTSLTPARVLRVAQ
jgi:cathepsin A (carboxypeptidase C)